MVATVNLSRFDPFGSSFRADPAAWHPELVAHSPGFLTMEDIESAYVASYADVTAVLRDFKRFSSVKPAGLPGMERIDFFNGQPVMNYSDPPEHVRRRKVVNAAFTPKRTEMLNVAAGATIEALLDKVEQAGRFDGMGDVAKPLSIQTLLGDFLGVEPEDRPIFLDFIGTLGLLDQVKPGGPKPKPYLDAWERGAAYCRAAIDRARHEKDETLIGLIAAASDDDVLSDDEMMAMMVVLFSGGVSTVAGAGGAALLNLARNPHIVERIRSDPSLAGAHLEESLRLDPPVSLVMRFATEDVGMNGRTIRRDMPVYAMISSACHDPAQFPDPERFDIDRPNGKAHLAFGHGMHTCIGNAITRSVIPMLVVAVARRFPDLRLAEPGEQIVFETTPRSRHVSRLALAA